MDTIDSFEKSIKDINKKLILTALFPSYRLPGYSKKLERRSRVAIIKSSIDQGHKRIGQTRVFLA